VVRAQIRGVFATFKTLRSGERRAYWYHRSTGRRLRGEPGSRDFMRDYAEAEKLTADRHSGTFNGLVREFTLSEEFTASLSPSTQRDYKRLLTYAEVEFGTMPIAALDDRRVRSDFLAWRDRVAKEKGRRGADYRLSAISSMLTWAEERGKVSVNHLRHFKRVYHNDRSELIWLPEHIEAFMQVAPVELQRAMILALHTGQRQGDLLRLTWSSYDGKAITLRQSKSRRAGRAARLVTIPCTRALKRMLDKLPRATTQVLTMASGKPWRAYTFRHDWKVVADAAGIKELHFNDLRGTAVTMLAEAGCTVPEIASITGHSLKHVTSILERYLARTRSLADAAIEKFENAKRTKFANRLQTGMRQPAKRGAK